MGERTRSVCYGGTQKLQMNVAVPSYFLCPISLELMRDPVTVSTGITYERASIETWLANGNQKCPATMQNMQSYELIPNRTLRKVIREWCALNHACVVEELPSPAEIPNLLQAIRSRTEVLESLRKLRTFVAKSGRNRTHAVDTGAIVVLLSYVGCTDIPFAEPELVEYVHEALSIIVLLSIVEKAKQSVVASPKVLACVCWFICSGELGAKINAAFILELMTNNIDVKGSIADLVGVTEGLVSLIQAGDRPKANEAGMKCLIAICTHWKIKAKAIKAGAVARIVEFLHEGESQVVLGRALRLLEILSTCKEGRETITNNGQAIPMLVKLLPSTCQTVTEHCLIIIWAVCQFAPNSGKAQQAAVVSGAVTRLLLLVQTRRSQFTRQKSLELLKVLRFIEAQHPGRTGTISCLSLI